MAAQPSLFALSLACLMGVVFGGCVDAPDSDAAGETPTPEPERWHRTLSIRMNETGAILIPIHVPQEATVQAGKMWLDGGSWRGYNFHLLDEEATGMQRWGGGFERHEYAERVYENRREGEYEVECLGEPDGDFCALYNDTARRTPTLVGEEYIFRNGAHLPAGFHYLVVHAAFESMFRVDFVLDEAIWVGEPIRAGAAAMFGPEHFRGEYLDMVRCGRIYWCGTMLDAEMPIPTDKEFALITVKGSSYYAAYANACVTDDTGESRCDDDGAPGVVGPALVYNQREVIRLELNPVITATMAGGPPLKEWESSLPGAWWVGGEYITFDLPNEHEARASV